MRKSVSWSGNEKSVPMENEQPQKLTVIGYINPTSIVWYIKFWKGSRNMGGKSCVTSLCSCSSMVCGLFSYEGVGLRCLVVLPGGIENVYPTEIVLQRPSFLSLLRVLYLCGVTETCKPNNVNQGPLRRGVGASKYFQFDVC